MAQRYFDVLAAQDDLDAQRGNLESVNRQLEQAEKRYEVGLIAITDVQEARAAHDSGAAAVIMVTLNPPVRTKCNWLSERCSRSLPVATCPIHNDA